MLEHLLETDRAIRADSRATELGRRLQEIPGVGPLVASALVATVPDPHVFESGRSLQFCCANSTRHCGSFPICRPGYLMLDLASC